MDFQDKKLICKDCSKEFTWTIGEQRFFSQKGFTNPPIRCLDCRKKKKEKVKTDNHIQSRESDQLYEIKCKNCGKVSEIPFKPNQPDNILCSECFEKTDLAK